MEEDMNFPNSIPSDILGEMRILGNVTAKTALPPKVKYGMNGQKVSITTSNIFSPKKDEDSLLTVNMLYGIVDEINPVNLSFGATLNLDKEIITLKPFAIETKDLFRSHKTFSIDRKVADGIYNINDSSNNIQNIRVYLNEKFLDNYNTYREFGVDMSTSFVLAFNFTVVYFLSTIGFEIKTKVSNELPIAITNQMLFDIINKAQ